MALARIFDANISASNSAGTGPAPYEKATIYLQIIHLCQKRGGRGKLSNLIFYINYFMHIVQRRTRQLQGLPRRLRKLEVHAMRDSKTGLASK